MIHLSTVPCSHLARSHFGLALGLALPLLMFAAPLSAQVGGERTAVEPRSITFPEAVVEELNATGEAFLPGTGMSVTLGEGITAVAGAAASQDEHLLVVDGVIRGLSTDENADEITRSADVEMMRPLASDHPGAARFGRPILLITTRNAFRRPNVTTGASESIRLRGTDPAGPTPLIYIDGVRMPSPGGEDPRLSISPDQIESIQILKGPAAVELYGPSGANGIIRITLKK